MSRRLLVSFAAAAAVALGVAGPVVAAAATVVVTPATTDWVGVDEGSPPSIAGFVEGIGTPPAGTGSFRFQTVLGPEPLGGTASSGGYLLAGAVHRGTRLSDIALIDFSSYSQSTIEVFGLPFPLAVVAPSLQIGWDPDLTTGDPAFYGRLVGFYDPTPTADTWLRWSTLDDFDWYLTRPEGDPNGSGCVGIANACDWATLAGAYPEGGVANDAFGFIGLKAGSGEGDTVRYADTLTVGVGSDTTTYDFELTAPPDPCPRTTVGTTITLLGPCTVSSTFLVPDGFSLDGDGYTITAVDPAGDHFRGAVVGNAGDEMHVVDLVVDADGAGGECDSGADRLAGIRFSGAGGSVSGTTVRNVIQAAGLQGCQEGNGIEIRNTDVDGNPAAGTRFAVAVTSSSVVRYQKTGILVTGNVAAEVTGTTITGLGPVDFIAGNGVQVSFGATALVEANTIEGNDYTPASFTACGLLLVDAAGVKQRKNTFVGNEASLCNLGRGGGTFGPDQ